MTSGLLAPVFLSRTAEGSAGVIGAIDDGIVIVRRAIPAGCEVRVGDEVAERHRNRAFWLEGEAPDYQERNEGGPKATRLAERSRIGGQTPRFAVGCGTSIGRVVRGAGLEPATF